MSSNGRCEEITKSETSITTQTDSTTDIQEEETSDENHNLTLLIGGISVLAIAGMLLYHQRF